MIYLILLSPFLGYLGFYLFGRVRRHWRQQRRAKLYARRFPEDWRQLLTEQYPLYKRLPEDLRHKLEGHIQVFLDEKNIIGRGEMEVTEAVRVLIAAQACTLIINKPTDYYPGFETILVYPQTYAAVEMQQDQWVRSESQVARAGESWHRGPVILSWNNVLAGARDEHDGHNVVMHEFAHKLDEENTYMDGLPILSDHTQYQSWAAVLSQEYQQQLEKYQQGEIDVIDAYAVTSPAEFFAVVTEVFFERPGRLLRDHPQLYHEFQRFYQLDPAHWPGALSY